MSETGTGTGTETKSGTGSGSESESRSGWGIERLEFGQLKEAIRLFLIHAYPDGEPPAAVCARLAWRTQDFDPNATPITQILTKPPFEHGNAPHSGQGAQEIYALRIGNHKYPHMKIQIQSWPHEPGYLFSVNTHDQALALTLGQGKVHDADRFRALQEINLHLKEVIEHDWDNAGIPTFTRFLKDYLDKVTPAAESGSDQGSVA